jgi:hypothetical protein
LSKYSCPNCFVILAGIPDITSFIGIDFDS